MRFRIGVLIVCLLSLWAVSIAAAQGEDPDGLIRRQHAIRAANAAIPGLGDPPEFHFAVQDRTSNSNLGCPLVGGYDLGRVLTPTRVELVYPSGTYVVYVTGFGDFIQLCDEKFGDKMVPLQPTPIPPTYDPVLSMCQFTAPNQPTMYAFPALDAPVIPGDVLVNGRAFPIGGTQSVDWIQTLNAAGQMGWVQFEGLTISNCSGSKPTAIMLPQYARSLCYITLSAGQANVRETFSLDSEVIRMVNAGEYWQVAAKSGNGEWYFINQGWVAVGAVNQYGDCSQVPVDISLYPGMPVPTALPTTDPNVTPTITPTMFLGTALPQEYVCPQGFLGYYKPRLAPGVDMAKVSEEGSGNRLRAEPNVAAEDVGFMDAGATVDRVITGPACSGGYVWWLVENAGRQGWTVESDVTTDYFLEPLKGQTATPFPTSTPTTTPTWDPSIPTLTPTMFLGTQLAPEYVCPPDFAGYNLPRIITGSKVARVTEGDHNNRLRTLPNTDTEKLGEIVAGNVIDRVITGPACGEGYVWWLVEHSGIQGWTVESGDGTYYIEPLPEFAYTETPIPSPTLTPSLTLTPSPTIDPSIPTATPTATITLTPSMTVPPTMTLPPTPIPEGFECSSDFDGALVPRIQIGTQSARVISGGLGNRLRAEPSSKAKPVGSADAGETLDRVIAGPRCGEGYIWWLVEEKGVQGWTVEASSEDYLMEPMPGFAVATPLPRELSCPTNFNGYLPSRIQLGTETAKVTEGLRNRLRAEPSTSGKQVGFMESGAVVDYVLSGPACSEGIVWWFVENAGIRGWTAESDGENYFLEPLGAALPTPTATFAG